MAARPSSRAPVEIPAWAGRLQSFWPGAHVVVNDIGTDGGGPDREGTVSAEAVAAEIRNLGGTAIANTGSVDDEDAMNAMVGKSIEAFGGVDILVNNAVVNSAAAFDMITTREFRRHMDVNLLGAIWATRAVWPHMRRKGYGRIVNVGSGAMMRLPMISAYGA